MGTQIINILFPICSPKMVDFPLDNCSKKSPPFLLHIQPADLDEWCASDWSEPWSLADQGDALRRTPPQHHTSQQPGLRDLGDQGGHPWGHGFKNYKEVLKAGAGWNWWSQHVSAWTVRSTHTLFISSPGNYLGKRPQTVLQRTWRRGTEIPG